MPSSFPSGQDTWTTKVDNVDTVYAADVDNLQLAVAQLEIGGVSVKAITYAATVTPNCNDGGLQTVALTGNITINNATNAVTGRALTLQFTQDGTGSRTVTWGGGYNVGGWQPNPSVNAISAIQLWYDGTKWQPLPIGPVLDGSGYAYHVKNPAYGAKWDGATDDLTAIVAARDAAAVTGGVVVAGGGTGLISATLTWFKGGVRFMGAGRGQSAQDYRAGVWRGTRIAPTSGFVSGNYLINADAASATPADALYSLGFSDFLLACTANGDPLGAALSAGMQCRGVWDLDISRVNVDKANGNGVNVTSYGSHGNSNWGRDVTVTGATAGGTTLGIQWCQFESGLINASCLTCGIGLQIYGGTQAGQSIINFTADSCVNAGALVAIDGVKFFGGDLGFAATSNGPNLNQQASHCRFFGTTLSQDSNVNGSKQISDSTGHTNNQWIGCHFAGATGGTLTPTIYDGGQGTAANPHQFIGGSIKDKTRYTAFFTVSGGNNFIVRSLLGFNPQGVATITVTASPFTYTNADFVDEMVYVSGGTITTITKGGSTLFSFAGAAANAGLQLAPGEACIVTYTVAPTMIKDRR